MSDLIEYTCANSGREILCQILKEEPTGTTLLDIETGERKPGYRLLLQPMDPDDGKSPFWSVTMAKVLPDDPR